MKNRAATPAGGWGAGTRACRVGTPADARCPPPLRRQVETRRCRHECLRHAGGFSSLSTLLPLPVATDHKTRWSVLPVAEVHEPAESEQRQQEAAKGVEAVVQAIPIGALRPLHPLLPPEIGRAQG